MACGGGSMACWWAGRLAKLSGQCQRAAKKAQASLISGRGEVAQQRNMAVSNERTIHSSGLVRASTALLCWAAGAIAAAAHCAQAKWQGIPVIEVDNEKDKKQRRNGMAKMTQA